MPRTPKPLRLAAAIALVALLAAFTQTVPVDWPMVARIREEGLQRSKVME